MFGHQLNFYKMMGGSVVVGEEDIPTIVSILSKPVSEENGRKILAIEENNFHYLIFISLDLCCSLEIIQKVKRSLMTGKLNSVDALTIIITDWIQGNGENATMHRFLWALSVNGPMIPFVFPLLQIFRLTGPTTAIQWNSSTPGLNKVNKPSSKTLLHKKKPLIIKVNKDQENQSASTTPTHNLSIAEEEEESKKNQKSKNSLSKRSKKNNSKRIKKLTICQEKKILSEPVIEKRSLMMTDPPPQPKDETTKNIIIPKITTSQTDSKKSTTNTNEQTKENPKKNVTSSSSVSTTSSSDPPDTLPSSTEPKTQKAIKKGGKKNPTTSAPVTTGQPTQKKDSMACVKTVNDATTTTTTTTNKSEKHKKSSSSETSASTHHYHHDLQQPSNEKHSITTEPHQTKELNEEEYYSIKQIPSTPPVKALQQQQHQQIIKSEKPKDFSKAIKLIQSKLQKLSMKQVVTPTNLAKGQQLIAELAENRIQLSKANKLARQRQLKKESRMIVAERCRFREHMESISETIWPKLLKKIKDPKDKAKMSQMAQQWRDALESEMTVILFHMVFLELTRGGNYLANADVLKLHIVCGEWKNSTENVFCSEMNSSIDEDDRIYSSALLHPLCPIYFENSDQLISFRNTFLQRYIQFAWNPLFSRQVVIWGLHDGFFETVTSFLLDFGREIWYICINLCPLNSCMTLQTILELLPLLPNLRNLRLVYNQTDINLKCTCGLENAMDRMYKALPELPQLTTLMLDDMPFPIAEVMFRKYGKSLKTAECRSSNENLMNILQQFQFPCLSTVIFRSYGLIHEFRRPAIHSLNDLRLDFQHVSPNDIVNIFKNINVLGHHSLRHLSLGIQKKNGFFEKSFCRLDKDIVKNLRLKLPQLETLWFLVLGFNLNTVDFLIPCTSLKQVKLVYHQLIGRKVVVCKKKNNNKTNHPSSSSSNGGNNHSSNTTSQQQQQQQLIKFTGLGSLYESNIWTVLPELQKLQIQVKKSWKQSSGRNNNNNNNNNKNSMKCNNPVENMIYTRKGYKMYLLGKQSR